MEQNQERWLANEKLQNLISKLEEGREGIKVDKKNIKFIKNFSYKYQSEEKNGDIIIIPVLKDGKKFMFIFDEEQKLIATEMDNKIKINDQYEISQKEQEDLIKEINNQDKEVDNNQETGEEELENDNNEQIADSDPKKDEEIKDLAENGISVNSQDVLIKLDKPLNGTNITLFNLLQLYQKLPGKLPKGLTAKTFEKGYFTWKKANEVSSIDGKSRDGENVPVIVTRDLKHIVEVDENILQKRPMKSKEEMRKLAQTEIRNDEDGIQAPKPKLTDQVTTSEIWDIVGARENANGLNVGGDIYSIVIRKKEPAVTGELRDSRGFKEECYLGRTPWEQSYTARERGENMILEELKSDFISGAEYTKNDRNLAEKESALEERKDSFREMARKILEGSQKIGEIYNTNDVTAKVEKYYNLVQGPNYLEELTKMIEADADKEHAWNSRNIN